MSQNTNPTATTTSENRNDLYPLRAVLRLGDAKLERAPWLCRCLGGPETTR